MNPNRGELRRITVYDGRGDAIFERVHVPDPPDIPDSGLASTTRLRHVMSNELTCASADLELAALVSLMSRRRIGCIPIVDRLGRAVGIVTKTDLVEHLETQIADATDIVRWVVTSGRQESLQ